jgi:hypothetical protein
MQEWELGCVTLTTHSERILRTADYDDDMASGCGGRLFIDQNEMTADG